MTWLHLLLTPDRSRWQPMLMGLAVFAAGAGVAVLLQPAAVSVLLLLVGLAAWVVGACAMVGYVRWYIGSEIRQAREDPAINERKSK